MEHCFVNIGAKGRAQRMRFGQLMLGLGVLLAVAMVVAGVAPAWRLPLFVPFVLGGVGVFQARAGT